MTPIASTLNADFIQPLSSFPSSSFAFSPFKGSIHSISSHHYNLCIHPEYNTRLRIWNWFKLLSLLEEFISALVQALFPEILLQLNANLSNLMCWWFKESHSSFILAFLLQMNTHSSTSDTIIFVSTVLLSGVLSLWILQNASDSNINKVKRTAPSRQIFLRRGCFQSQ